MTLGKKIALGFGTLILIAALLGGMAVFNMKSVQSQAAKLAAAYVPETKIANDLDSAIAAAQLGVRSYGFTADDAYLADSRKGMEEVHKLQQAAQKLADDYPELAVLREHLKELQTQVKSFEDLINQTEAKNTEVVGTREKLNKTAADFISDIDKLIAAQYLKLDKEIDAGVEAGKLKQRSDKVRLATEIRGGGNAARIAVFKSQALRDPKVIEEGLNGFEVMDKKFGELQAMLTVQEDIAELNQVKENAHNYRDAMKEILADNLSLAELGKKRLEVASKLGDLAGETAEDGTKETVDAANDSTRQLASASWIMVAGLGVALLLGTGVAYFIIRGTNKVLSNIANALNDGSNQVASAAAQVSSSSQSLAEGASEQAASLEESSSSLEEMASMTKRNGENAQKANDLAKQARSAADKGATDMQAMSAAMDAIKTSSDDIAKIIKTIDEIAFQTNILALNAAVEAARAGEAGMGFAVVADEVRNLAQRSAQAAKETAGKIEGAITKTAQGVDINNKVAQALNEIVIKARQVDELVAEVTSASKEQTQGITQINTAVGQMDKVTQSNAANAEEGAAAAEELNAQAETMKQSVAELLQLVGGQGQPMANRPAPSPTRPKNHQSVPATPKHSNSTNGNGRGHAPLVLAKAEAGHRSNSPTEGDFKDF